MGLDMYIVNEQGEEVSYYRKFNALHGYFEERFSENQILNATAPITQDVVDDIAQRVARILNHDDKRLRESYANELLPTTIGFFYGSYEYNEYYFDCLKELDRDLIKWNEILADEENNLYYGASW